MRSFRASLEYVRFAAPLVTHTHTQQRHIHTRDRVAHPHALAEDDRTVTTTTTTAARRLGRIPNFPQFVRRETNLRDVTGVAKSARARARGIPGLGNMARGRARARCAL